jgi:hypothetical protein
MSQISLSLALAAIIGSTAVAAEPAKQTTTGGSEMSVGFTPPPKPPEAHHHHHWTREEQLLDARRRLDQGQSLPRCQQDRLLTDTTPCDSAIRPGG